MKNAYARKLQQGMKRQMAARQQIAIQMAKDAAMLAAHEVFQMGRGRAAGFSAAFDQALREIAQLTVEDTPDMAYTKAKLDARLAEICGTGFVPWEERYG